MIKYESFTGGTVGLIKKKMIEWRSKHKDAKELFHDVFDSNRSIIITYDDLDLPKPAIEPTPVFEEPDSLPEETEIAESEMEATVEPVVKRGPGRPKKAKEAN